MKFLKVDDVIVFLEKIELRVQYVLLIFDDFRLEKVFKLGNLTFNLFGILDLLLGNPLVRIIL